MTNETQFLFPVYRKFKGREVYFKIVNELEFEQKQLVGTKLLVDYVIASQYPEKLYILDMLNNVEQRYEEVESAIYENIK
jgi:hypothetical protein